MGRSHNGTAPIEFSQLVNALLNLPWGNHTLVITNDYGAPSAFELVAPVINDEAVFLDEEPAQETITP